MVGGLLGAIAGYGSRRVDDVIMRVMDIFLAIPSILLSIALVSAMGTSVTNMMLAISISNIPPFARIVRSAVLTIKNEEYIEAVETLYEIVKLRGESISGQLDGTIPSTSAEQSGSDALIDASHIDLEVMGSMDIGGGFSFGGQDANQNQAEPPALAENSDSESMESSENPFGGFDTSQVQGEMPENFDASQFGDFDPSQFGSGAQGSGENAGEDSVPSFDGFPGAGTENANASSVTTLSQYGLSLAVIAIAFLFAVFYRRKPRRR